MKWTSTTNTTAALLSTLLICSGCAGFSPVSGGGAYQYEKTTATGDVCRLTVDSNRVMEAGVDVEITQDCGIKVKATSVTQGEAAALLKVLSHAVKE